MKRSLQQEVDHGGEDEIHHIEIDGCNKRICRAAREEHHESQTHA